MSRRLDHRHQVRLYVEKAALWNPAGALNVRLRASRRSLQRAATCSQRDR
jgi:hypothetical protein